MSWIILSPDINALIVFTAIGWNAWQGWERFVNRPEIYAEDHISALFRSSR